MTLCICDGPAHLYSPGWCREGKDSQGAPINKLIAAAQLELKAAQLRAESNQK